MSVAVQFEISREGRVIPELPKGVTPFSAAGTVTGDVTGGECQLTLSFNPNVDRTFQPWVAIQMIILEVSTADPLDGEFFAYGAEWERLVRAGVPSSPRILPVVTTTTDARFIWDSFQWINLGRAQLGTLSRVEIHMANVDTAVYLMYVTGVIADRPFAIPAEMSI